MSDDNARLQFLSVGYDPRARRHLIWGATSSGQGRYVSLTHKEALSVVAQVARDLANAEAAPDA